MSDQRLKVLFLTATFPSPRDPVSGTFVYEQAKALLQFVDILVLVPIPLFPPLPRYRQQRLLISKCPKGDNREGVEIRYVKYLYLPSFLENFSHIPVLLSALWAL